MEKFEFVIFALPFICMWFWLLLPPTVNRVDWSAVKFPFTSRDPYKPYPSPIKMAEDFISSKTPSVGADEPFMLKSPFTIDLPFVLWNITSIASVF